MRLSGWHLPAQVLSASALTLGMQCPEQYRQKHVLKKKEPVYSDRFIGTIDHELFSTAMRHKLEGFDFDESMIESTYTRLWHSEIERRGEPEWKEKPEKLFDLGVKMAKTYYNEIGHAIEPVRVEERFEFSIKEIPVPIVGYIDTERKDDILERKTAKQRMSKPKPGWRFQGRIYQLAADKPVSWHVITKQVTPQVCTPENTNGGLYLERVNNDVTVSMIVQAAKTLNEYAARYGLDGTWPMTGTFHDWLCDYCAFGPRYSGVCSAWQ